MTDDSETRYLYGVRDGWCGPAPGRLRILDETAKTFTVQLTEEDGPGGKTRIFKSNMRHWWLGKLCTSIAEALDAAVTDTEQSVTIRRKDLREAEKHEQDMRQMTVEQAMTMIEAGETT